MYIVSIIDNVRILYTYSECLTFSTLQVSISDRYVDSFMFCHIICLQYFLFSLSFCNPLIISSKLLDGLEAVKLRWFHKLYFQIFQHTKTIDNNTKSLNSESVQFFFYVTLFRESLTQKPLRWYSSRTAGRAQLTNYSPAIKSDKHWSRIKQFMSLFY